MKKLSKDSITNIIIAAVSAAVLIALIVAAAIINGNLSERSRQTAGNYLSLITIEKYTFSPEFDKNTVTYNMTVLDEIDSLNIVAIPETQSSKVKILGNLNFTEGQNVITIIVTATDGTSKNYEIIVDYQPSVPSDENSKGNLGKNLMNGGIAAIQGDYIYYTTNSGEVYKQKTDGSSKLLLAPAGSTHINVVDDWVYYINNFTVYAVRTDGTQTHPLSNNNTGNDIYARHLMVYNGYFYYANALRGNNGYLFRIPLNYDETAIPTKLTGHIPSKFIVNEDLIYFISDNKDDNIYTIPINGGSNVKITDVGVTSFNIDPATNRIYYLATSDLTVYSCNLDGSDVTKVLENVTDFIIDGDYIIYSTGDRKSFIATKDGSEPQKISICDYATNSYSIVGSYVYFNLEEADDDVKYCRFLRNYSGITIQYSEVSE
ncbi:MAG: DUF5050 domain-containing protein [Clostridia bacterium]|nr:DUF5050 domain-containing protein [Clostridia bacterium]